MITEGGKCEAEIRSRIVTTKEAIAKRKKELLTKNMNIEIKKIVKTVVGTQIQEKLYPCSQRYDYSFKEAYIE